MNKEQFDFMKTLILYDEFMDSVYKFQNITRPVSVKEFVNNIVPVVIQNKEKNPMEMFDQVFDNLTEIWSASEKIPFNAGWFHGLLPAVLMNALKNNGYQFTDDDTKEAFARGIKLPPAGCGFCGICGATGGTGVIVSMILKATPFHDEERATSIDASLIATQRLKDIGGVRCCRLSSYVAIEETTRFLRQLDYSLPEKNRDWHCPVNTTNDECNGKKCPFFPRR